MVLTIFLLVNYKGYSCCTIETVMILWTRMKKYTNLPWKRFLQQIINISHHLSTAGIETRDIYYDQKEYF